MVASVAVLDALTLIADAIPSLNPPTPIYAVFRSDSLIPLTIPSSWLAFELAYENAISDYPQQTGAFQPYNKVRRPQTIRVTMVKTGSDLARLTWLAAIQQQEANNPTQLYTLLSPEGIFVNYTIASLRKATRTDRGQNILYLDIEFLEVPQIPAAAGTYDNTSEAKSGPVQQLGQLYTSAATAVQNAAINAQAFILG